MRLVSYSAVIAALTISLTIAPRSAGADDVTRPRKERRVRQVPSPRHWGTDNLIPTVSRSGPRDGILPDAVVEYNTATDRISHISAIDINRGIPVAGASSPREAVERYLKANHAALGLSADLSELRLEREAAMGGAVRFTYAQHYKGLPVFGATINAIAQKDAVLRIAAELVPLTDAGKVFASSDSTAAIKAVADDVNSRYPSPQDERFKPKATFGLLVREATPVSAWEIDYVTKDDGYRAYVDAATNQVLSVTSMSIDN